MHIIHIITCITCIHVNNNYVIIYMLSINTFYLVIIYMIYILLLVLIIMLMFVDNVEHYQNIVPYSYNWNIFKCLDRYCVIKKSYDCYKYCQTLDDVIGGDQQCQLQCLDLGDEMFDYIKYQNYTWGNELKVANDIRLFKHYDND